MDYYVDIRILPDPDFETTVVMRALFARLHKALVTLGTDAVGVSFPGFRTRPAAIGSEIRVHASRDTLDELFALAWLSGVRDHVVLDGPHAVPSNVKHRSVRRVQPKGAAERLARRYAKRHGVSDEEALAIYRAASADTVRLPYIRMHSSSTGEGFSLFIEHGPIVDTPIAGTFSSYGLSDGATVPWF